MFSVANVLWLFGFFALYAHLASSRAERWAFAAMIVSVVAAVYSIVVLVGEEVHGILIGQAYLEGRQDIYEIFIPFSTLTPTIVLAIIASFSGGVLGSILLAIAIWRSGTLPQGAAIIIAASAVLTGANVLSAGIAVLTSGLQALGFGWVAWSILRQPSTGISGTEASPRVQ